MISESVHAYSYDEKSDKSLATETNSFAWRVAAVSSSRGMVSGFSLGWRTISQNIFEISPEIAYM